MTPNSVLVMSSVVAVAGAWLVVSGYVQRRPPLARLVAHLRRAGDAGTLIPSRADRVASVVGRVPGVERLVPTAAGLRLVGSDPNRHLTRLVVAGAIGALGPALAMVLLVACGIMAPGMGIPALAVLGGALLGPLAVHSHVTEQIRDARTDLRHQLSAYLDVVTMLLAGNRGHEGALHEAALAGDGRLFRTVRRHLRERSAAGESAVRALASAADELGLVELEQVAATAGLSADEGAPVARTLAAKCTSLRSALAADQEAVARLRTSRLTTPIVGMALVFMSLVIYPALSST
jgi:tight adherence protein C